MKTKAESIHMWVHVVQAWLIMLYLHSICLSMFPISELKAQLFYQIIAVFIFFEFNVENSTGNLNACSSNEGVKL